MCASVYSAEDLVKHLGCSKTLPAVKQAEK